VSELATSKAPFHSSPNHCHDDEEGHDAAKSSNYKQIVALVTGKPVNLKMSKRSAVALSSLHFELVLLLHLPQPQKGAITSEREAVKLELKKGGREKGGGEGGPAQMGEVQCLKPRSCRKEIKGKRLQTPAAGELKGGEVVQVTKTERSQSLQAGQGRQLKCNKGRKMSKRRRTQPPNHIAREDQ